MNSRCMMVSNLRLADSPISTSKRLTTKIGRSESENSCARTSSPRRRQVVQRGMVRPWERARAVLGCVADKLVGGSVASSLWQDERHPGVAVSESPMLCLPFELPCLALDITMRAEGEVTRPGFQAGFWRGVIGRALHVMTRLQRLDDEAAPGALEDLLADWFAEAQAPGRPRPYVIRAPADPRPMTLPPGAPLGFEIVLVDPVPAEIRQLLRALVLAGEFGVGAERTRAYLDGVRVLVPHDDWLDVTAAQAITQMPATPLPLFDSPPLVELDLWSPLALKHKGRVVGADAVTAPLWLRRLLERIRALAAIRRPELADFDLTRFRAAADSTRFVELQLHGTRRTRFSRRGDDIIYEGLVGRAVMDIGGAPELWPWIVLAPWVHVGRGTSMGGGGVALFHPDGPPLA